MENYNFLIHKPENLTENTQLILLLHGYGSNKEDLFSFKENISEDKLIISLQAPISLSFGGFAWYEINFMDSEKFNNLEQAKESQDYIINFIDFIHKSYKFNKENICLCGFSQGAILSYSLILNNPQKFKFGICLSGYLDQKIVGNINNQNDYSKLKFYCSHGTEDNIIPIEWARKTPIFLNEYSIKNDYKEYNQGHGLNPQNYQDMLYWIQNNLK